MTNVTNCNDDGGDSAFEKMEPFILFGSSFPRDKEYTQVCETLLFDTMIMYCLDFKSREVTRYKSKGVLLCTIRIVLLS